MREMAQEFCNPFKSEYTMNFELENGLFECFGEEQNPESNKVLSEMISINQNYKKLNQAYQDVKKMATTYIDTTNDKQVSKLESKLNRYYS